MDPSESYNSLPILPNANAATIPVDNDPIYASTGIQPVTELIASNDMKTGSVRAKRVANNNGKKNHSYVQSAAVVSLNSLDSADEEDDDEHTPKGHKRKNKEISSKADDINSSNTTTCPPKFAKTQVQSWTQIPISLFKAFNGGDINKVKEIIKEVTLKNCTLKTLAIETELQGQNYVMDLFESLYESHPDVVIVAKKCRFCELTNQVLCRIYFAGTRIVQYAKSSSDMTGTYADYLFKKRGSSLLDEMDITTLSEADIIAIKKLENAGCNLSVFAKGNMALTIDTCSGKVSKWLIEWTITSFREANL